MRLNRGTRIFIGLATLATYLLPFIAAAFWFLAIFGIIAAIAVACPGSGRCDPPPLLALMFPLLWFAFVILIMLTLFLSLALRIFYHVHITLNKSASDMFRVITTIGLFFVPFIAEPLYFYACIWRDSPPGWAMPPLAVPTAP